MNRITLFAILLLPSFLFGAISPDGQGQALLQIFADASNQWGAAIKPTAQKLFWGFVTIDFVITFGFIALKGGEIMEMFGVLMQKILVIGFFLAVFQGANMMDKIPASFDKLAFQASGIDIQPDVVLEQGIELVGKMWEALDFSIDSLVMVFAGIISLVAFALMAAQLFIVLVKIQALMVGAYLMFAFGGWSRTMDLAINPLKAIFAAGMELMFIKLFMGLTYTTIEKMTDNVGNDSTSALMIIIVSILLASVVTMIGSMVSSLMAGTISSNSTAGLGIAAGAVGGAAAGVAASAKHGTGMASAVKAAKQAAANSGGSAMGHFARAMGSDMVDTVKGKNARNTTSAASRAADAMKSQSGSGGSNQSSGGDGEISKGNK